MKPPHGTLARYVGHHACRCDKCRAAQTRYTKAYRLDRQRGNTRTADATGSRRRLQALMAINWGKVQLAAELGIPLKTFEWIRSGHVQRVRIDTARRIADGYERLCMTPGRQPKAGTWARKLGYLPPLAWDDIDNDPAPYMPTDQDAPDEVVIWRLMNGQPVTSTLTERREATRRLLDAGHTVTHIATCLHVSGTTARDLITNTTQEVAA